MNALRRTQEALKGATHLPLITVGDRESDFFELLEEFTEQEALFVLRAQHNRSMGKGEKKLFDQLKSQDDIGEVNITLQDVNNREIKEVGLKVKCLQEVKIPFPPAIKTKRTGKSLPVIVNMVMLYNKKYCWILLTNLPVETLEECKTVGKIYKERWHIEDYHKVLKTGYQVDELYLHSSRQAIETALTMAAISACRLYWLIYKGRTDKHREARELFKEYEWKAIYVYFKETIPPRSPPLCEVILRIARLGGYKERKNASPPGIKTLWIGFQHFTTIANMYESMKSIKT